MPTTRPKAAITGALRAGRRCGPCGGAAGGSGRRDESQAAGLPAADSVDTPSIVALDAVVVVERVQVRARRCRRRTRPAARPGRRSRSTTYGGESGRKSTRMASPAERIADSAVSRWPLMLIASAPAAQSPLTTSLQVAVEHPALGGGVLVARVDVGRGRRAGRVVDRDPQPGAADRPARPRPARAAGAGRPGRPGPAAAAARAWAWSLDGRNRVVGALQPVGGARLGPDPCSSASFAPTRLGSGRPQREHRRHGHAAR